MQLPRKELKFGNKFLILLTQKPFVECKLDKGFFMRCVYRPHFKCSEALEPCKWRGKLLVMKDIKRRKIMETNV